MNFAQEVNRLLAALLLGLLVVAGAAAYWAVFGPDTILLRQDNPRIFEDEARLIRGGIVDRNGVPIALTTTQPDGTSRREYLIPEMYSATGYSSLRYGVSGAEAAYNARLRGELRNRNWFTRLGEHLLHSPQRGDDIRLTYDIEIQRELVKLMGNHTGAAVMMAVPSGEILALISNPTYDPNTLNENWSALTADPGNPFFNRALQGAYQPGGMLQILLIASALLSGHSPDMVYPAANQAIRLGDVTLHCASPSAPAAQNLREAFSLSCPAPFADLATRLGPEVLTATFDAFQINKPPTLPGYVATSGIQPQPYAPLRPETLVEVALGQGDVRLTPLGLAAITAAIVADGNAPVPHTLLASREPDSTTWLTQDEARSPIALTTSATAREIRFMLQTSSPGNGYSAPRQEGLDIGGHVAVAFSGEEALTWFTGFAMTSARDSIVLTLVLENTNDPVGAAEISRRALELGATRMKHD